MESETLHGRLTATARRYPDRLAVVDSYGNALSYEQLELLSSRVASALGGAGVTRGDRVGICLPKAADAVAAIYGAMKAGASYVPVDVRAPVSRNVSILRDCRVAAVITDPRHAELLREGLAIKASQVLVDDAPTQVREDGWLKGHGTNVQAARLEPDDLAYLLYTSGTTGLPKGVQLSHRNATAFVDWCLEAFSPNPEDRYASHAGFHFDLSIHDLYVPVSCGAAVALIGEDVALHPRALLPFITEQQISIWYSVPSALSLLLDHGELRGADVSRLRVVLTAGEVFPLPKLRALTEQWPHPRYYNLYGPTETNVCTFHAIELPIPADRKEPFPIGHPCSAAMTRVVAPEGKNVEPGQEGELWVCGPSVTAGYWERPELNEKAFVNEEARRWYRTGDIVVQTDLGYLFLGRRDRMVKRRGYRIELGDVEAALQRHPHVRDAAVVAIEHSEATLSLRAFVVCDGRDLSTLAIRQHCAGELPAYMIPDEFELCGDLPRTSTGKVDLKALALGTWNFR